MLLLLLSLIKGVSKLLFILKNSK